MHKLIVPESMSGFALTREIENHLFETNNPNGRLFFRRAKQETAVHSNNEESFGWVGHNKLKVIELAKEFGIEVEFKP